MTDVLTAARAPSGTPVLRITPDELGLAQQLLDVWTCRELLGFLVWRDLKVRYKQTLLGAAWAVVQPLMTMIVFSVFFGYLGRIPSDGHPYPLFAYAALVPWTLFAYGLSESSQSLVANQTLITKVYFPRLVVPLVPIVTGLVDFAIASLVLLGMLFVYGVVPGIAILCAPLFVLLALVTSLAAGLWLSALNVQFRDVRYTIPFLTQLWLFASPVAYPSTLLPEPWRTIYGLNPMVGAIEGFRWAVLPGTPAPGALITLSIAAVGALLIGGLYYFLRVERIFADVV